MRKLRKKENLYREGFKYDAQNDYCMNPKIIIGEMKYECVYCNALKFKSETPGMCCANGKVTLPQLKPPPEPLQSYVSNDSEISKYFLKNTFQINDIFKFTSFGASKILNKGCYLPTFKIQGNLFESDNVFHMKHFKCKIFIVIIY